MFTLGCNLNSWKFYQFLLDPISLFSLPIPGIILGYRLYFVSKQVTDVVTVKDSSKEIVYQLKNLGNIFRNRNTFFHTLPGGLGGSPKSLFVLTKLI